MSYLPNEHLEKANSGGRSDDLLLINIHLNIDLSGLCFHLTLVSVAHSFELDFF